MNLDSHRGRNKMKIDEEFQFLPSELLVPSRIARTNMVNTMAASIDFKDKIQRELFLKAKKSAIAALGAIDIADNVELFEKQLYLEMKRL